MPGEIHPFLVWYVINQAVVLVGHLVNWSILWFLLGIWFNWSI